MLWSTAPALVPLCGGDDQLVWVHVQWHHHGVEGQVLCVQLLGGLCQVLRDSHPVHWGDKKVPPAHPQLQGGGRALGQARVQHSQHCQVLWFG